MGETINLQLDVSEEAGNPRQARIYVEMACSYLKGQGAPTLTAACASLADLDREITRLKEELDELRERASKELGDPAAAGSTGAGAQGTESMRASKAPRPADKTRLRIRDDLRVEDEMTREVKTMHRNDMLSIADELMKIGGFRHVVVVEDGSDAVAGIISQRDIFYGAMAWSTGHGEVAHQQALDTVSVKNVMHGDVTTVAPDTPLADAARIMLEQKIGCLPVVRNERLVGVLTEGDFLSMLTRAEYSERAPNPS